MCILAEMRDAAKRHGMLYGTLAGLVWRCAPQAVQAMRAAAERDWTGPRPDDSVETFMGLEVLRDDSIAGWSLEARIPEKRGRLGLPPSPWG